MLLLRTLITLGLVVTPFVLLALANGKAEGMLWLMLPFMAAIPVLLAVIVVFIPAEYAATCIGAPANLLVPLAGSLLGVAVLVVSIMSNQNKQSVLARIWAGDLSTLGAMAGTIIAGMLLGVAWRTSAWVITRLGWD